MTEMHCIRLQQCSLMQSYIREEIREDCGRDESHRQEEGRETCHGGK